MAQAQRFFSLQRRKFHHHNCCGPPLATTAYLLLCWKRKESAFVHIFCFGLVVTLLIFPCSLWLLCAVAANSKVLENGNWQYDMALLIFSLTFLLSAKHKTYYGINCMNIVTRNKHFCPITLIRVGGSNPAPLEFVVVSLGKTLHPHWCVRM